MPKGNEPGNVIVYALFLKAAQNISERSLLLRVMVIIDIIITNIMIENYRVLNLFSHKAA